MIPGPASAVFVSTVRGWAWGAPDLVWPQAAARLRERGIPVTAVVHPGVLDHPEIRDLRSAGVAVHAQPEAPPAGGHLSRLRRALRPSAADRRLRRHLAALDRPHFLFNQGGPFDLAHEPFFHPFLAPGGATYDIFVHLALPQAPADEATRDRRADLFRRARRCWFNSAWTRTTVEQQLLARLGNAGLFHYRPKTRPETPLPWPAPAPAARLATVSRLDVHHKGFDVLLAALAALPTDVPPWRLDIFGDGPDRGHLEGLVRWHGLGDRVVLRGPADDIAAVWREQEMLVLTSRFEGLAVTMLEAMACGRPVLRTAYGGAEWIDDGRTGFLCAAAEPGLVAEQLARALRRRADWPAMGRAAAETIAARLPADPWSAYLEPFPSLP